MNLARAFLIPSLLSMFPMYRQVGRKSLTEKGPLQRLNNELNQCRNTAPGSSMVRAKSNALVNDRDSGSASSIKTKTCKTDSRVNY